MKFHYKDQTISWPWSRDRFVSRLLTPLLVRKHFYNHMITISVIGIVFPEGWSLYWKGALFQPYQPCIVNGCEGSNHCRRSTVARRLTPVNGRMLMFSAAGSVNIWRNLGEALASKYLDVWSWCPSTSMMRSARGSGWLKTLSRSSHDAASAMLLSWWTVVSAAIVDTCKMLNISNMKFEFI